MARKAKKGSPSGLSAAQEAFCQHYALHRNGAEAYRHAYPNQNRHSPEYQTAKAKQLMANPNIKVRIEVLSLKAGAVAEKKFEITAEKILSELASIAFQNAEDYFKWGYIEKPVLRVNRKTGEIIHVRDADGQPMFRREPYAEIKPSDELTRTQKTALVSVSETISRTGDKVIEPKMADKMRAIEMICKIRGLFKEKVEHTGANGGPIQQSTTVTLPDLSKIKDPRDALRAFEAFRMASNDKPLPNSKAN
jgi:phage terminase small subunit